MAGPSLELEMRLKDQKLAVGMDALAAKEEKIDQGLAKISRTARQADSELNRFAKRTTEVNATPLERYTVQMSRLDSALQRGKISQDTYTRAVASAKQKLDDAGRSQREALSPLHIGQIAQFASGYLTLGAAVNIVADAFRHASEESKAALSSLRSIDDERRNLAQIAESPADLNKMLERSDKAALAAGVDRKVAAQVMFEARSLGFEKEFEDVVGANPVIKAEAAARLAGKVPSMLGGKITARQSINMAIAAAAPSEINAEQLADSMAIALEGGRRVGAKPDESFAVVSALSKPFKSPQVAADRVKALTNKMAQVPELRDKGIMGGYRALKAMDEGERRKILGEDQESNAAYEAMVEFEKQIVEIEKATRIARETTGTKADVLERQKAILMGSPKAAASLQLRQAEIGKEIERENFKGIDEAQRQTMLLRMSAGADKQRLSFWQRTGMYRFGLLAEAAEAGPGATRAAVHAGKWVGGIAGGGGLGAGGEQFSPLKPLLWPLMKAMIDYLRSDNASQIQVLQKIEQNTASGAATARGRAIQNEALQPLN